MKKKTIILYRVLDNCPLPDQDCTTCSFRWEGQCCVDKKPDKPDEDKE